MANQDYLDLLKQGVECWNQWRREHRYIVFPDLGGADLSAADLTGANLNFTNLTGANLREANLRYANLGEAYLSGADLTRTGLWEANLYGASLEGANISYANLHEANLSAANLSAANFTGASLEGANISYAKLIGADLGKVRLSKTVFVNNDLRAVKGLVEIIHEGPSFVYLHTVELPQDGSALHFLRGAGVPDEWIDFWRTTMMHPIQYHSCFISYSSHDEALAHRLHADLQDKGVRCWFAPEDMKIGDKIRARIDEAIHLQDKLLLLLSEHALASAWVEDEVEAALEKEQRQQREVLFPVCLDENVMQTTQPWAAKLRRTRHIGDFTHWTNPQAYQHAFDRLLRDLKTGNSTKEEIDNKPDAS